MYCLFLGYFIGEKEKKKKQDTCTYNCVYFPFIVIHKVIVLNIFGFIIYCNTLYCLFRVYKLAERKKKKKDTCLYNGV
jgi:hypothetical protein